MTLAFNADLLTVGIAVAATVILGFVIFLQDPKNKTNALFLFFTLSSAAWSIVNYVSYQTHNAITGLWLVRLVLFTAIAQAVTFFLLMYVFPEKEKVFPIWIKKVIIPISSATAILTLTPLVFKSAAIISNQAPHPVIGPAIPIFAVVGGGLVVGGIGILIRKILKSKPDSKKQFKTLLAGVLFMFVLILGLDFLLPAFFDNTRFVPLGGLFILPFVLFTAYAIIKQKLFNVKVVTTSVLVFALDIGLLFEVIFTTQLSLLIFRISLFLLVLGVGVLLIRSVLREVKQREELQVLTKQLGEANEQLKQLDKARAEFISIASHQLRTPPATIKWYLGAILTGDFGALSQELKAAIERTNVTNNAQIHTIDDLLNASRIERGKLEFFFEKGKVEPIVSSLVEQLRPLAEMKKLKLEYTPPVQVMPEILLDQEKVRQVINNMIDNAIKYSKQGTIVVNLKQDQDNLVISVKDNGKGISPEEIRTLFEKYSRGKDSVTHATGLGLGMYVAKVIVEQHRGKIWAESPGVGQGSTFFFSLPIHSDLKPTIVDLVAAQKSA